MELNMKNKTPNGWKTFLEDWALDFPSKGRDWEFID